MAATHMLSYMYMSIPSVYTPGGHKITVTVTYMLQQHFTLILCETTIVCTVQNAEQLQCKYCTCSTLKVPGCSVHMVCVFGTLLLPYACMHSRVKHLVLSI